MDLNMLVLLGGRERTEEEYRRLLQEAGFVNIEIEPTRIYEFADALARQVGGRIMGAFIRARKPA